MTTINQKAAVEAIANRTAFEASALSAKFMNYTPSAGRLGAESTRLADDFKPGAYIVFSYGTPIAWFGAQGWYVVSEKFSATTSKHQGIVRRAVASREMAVA